MHPVDVIRTRFVAQGEPKVSATYLFVFKAKKEERESILNSSI